jgi:hypothetical protein
MNITGAIKELRKKNTVKLTLTGGGSCDSSITLDGTNFYDRYGHFNETGARHLFYCATSDHILVARWKKDVKKIYEVINDIGPVQAGH